MSLFGGTITVSGISFLMFCVFAILVLGYALGRIKIKGISLGDAGVFIVALLFGVFFYEPLESQLVVNGVVQAGFADKALEIIESLGLILFVTSVGFIAGPGFFCNLKKNFKSYALLSLVIVLSGGLSAIGCIFVGREIGFGSSIQTNEGFTAMIVGLLSGSITSTPAFAAAKATVAEEYTNLVSVGHGISYIFGVIGIVLFVQIIPKLTKADMAKERAKIAIKQKSDKDNTYKGKLLKLDNHGIASFALASVLGVFLGKIMIPLSGDGLQGACFSLTTTGGCLLSSLIFGHFGKIGKISIIPEQTTLKLFRELGLVFFLVGAGIPGGADFIENFDPMYFVYGVVMSIIPLVVGYLFAKYVLKLSLLNNLGAITGGRTSTPALGTLISVAETEDVVPAYASTYPVSLILVVLVSQFIIIFF